MLAAYFKSISIAMIQIFFLGLVGFVIVRKKVISAEGVTGLTRLLIEVVFPALIFWQIVTKFSFQAYANWWKFFSLSLAITGLGLFTGFIFSLSFRDGLQKREFMSLVSFQNSGYLPLSLLGWIVPKEQLSTILIYLFLFLLGFNLVIWSWGVYFLSAHKARYFSFSSLFSPPVVATLAGFVFVLLKINVFIPKFVLSPLEMLGNCSFPFAVLVVGANLADLYAARPIDIKLMTSLILAKLIMLPLIGLAFISLVKVPYYAGMFIILQLAVPSATSLAVIARRYFKEETLISQGIFVTHIVSLVTLPLFLAAYNWIVLKS